MIIRKGLWVSIGNENYSAMLKILLLKIDSSYMKLIFLDSYSERENKKSDFCGQFFLLFKIFKSSRNRTYTSNFGDWRATTALCSFAE